MTCEMLARLRAKEEERGQLLLLYVLGLLYLKHNYTLGVDLDR